jgi:hypothetical protein
VGKHDQQKGDESGRQKGPFRPSFEQEGGDDPGGPYSSKHPEDAQDPPEPPPSEHIHHGNTGGKVDPAPGAQVLPAALRPAEAEQEVRKSQRKIPHTALHADPAAVFEDRSHA